MRNRKKVTMQNLRVDDVTLKKCATKQHVWKSWENLCGLLGVAFSAFAFSTAALCRGSVVLCTSTVAATDMGLGLSPHAPPRTCRLAPSSNILVKNQEAYCTQFSKFDRLCTRNL